MREILFRGKRIDNCEWVEGYFLTLPNAETVILSYAGYAYVNPETIGQYTGLTDKNGKKVFEGDIVSIVYEGALNTFVVVWDAYELDFKATNGKENYGIGGFQYLSCCDVVEVIGNVYDNPELLKENENA